MTWVDPATDHTHANDHVAVTLSAELNSALLGLSGQELTLDNQPAHQAFMGPASGGAGIPGFRTILAEDLGSGMAANYILTSSGVGVTSWASPSEVAATMDHGDLDGLDGDDHTQYLTNARHEALVADLHYGKAATGAGAPGTTFEGIMWLDTDEEAPAVALLADMWFML